MNTRIVRAPLLVLLACTWVLLAQPPREEEEEKPAPKPMPKSADPKIPAVKEVPAKEKESPKGVEPAPRTKVGKSVREMYNGTDLKREMLLAKNPLAKEFFKRLSLPYDALKTTGGVRYNVVPVPNHDLESDEEKIQFQELGISLQTVKPLELPASAISKPIISFEEIVIREIVSFLKEPIEGLSKADQFEIGLKGLIATMDWHDAYVQSKRRVGKKWEVIRGNLDSLRKDTEFKFIEALVQERKYNKLEPLLEHYVAANPDDAFFKRLSLRSRLMKWEDLFKANKATESDYRGARVTLMDYEQTLPTKSDPLSDNVRKYLRERAEKLLAEAKEFEGRNQPALALGRLRTAESLDPELPAIRDIRKKIRDRILFVGVHRLPERLSPATARTDVERWALELLFERLIQPIPDMELGVTYRNSLTKELPKVANSGREILLQNAIRWNSEKVTDPVDAMDVRGTIQGMQIQPLQSYTEGVQDVTAVERIDNPFQFRVGLKAGVIDPLGALTFHLQPAKWLQGQGKRLDDNEFSRKPFGTGPYRYDGREPDGAGRESAIFRKSDLYSQRPGKIGLPVIPEIRFVVPRNEAIVEDFRTGQLHVYVDPKLDLARRVREDAGILSARLYSIKQPMRIHLLAMNHRVEALSQAEVRRGIGYCINREAILGQIRIPGEDNPVPLRGPFPANSWAEIAQASSLDRVDAGRALLTDYMNKGRALRLNLVYSLEDPRNELLAQQIKNQLEQIPKLTIDIEGLPIDRFEKRVDIEHNYELALTKIDYADPRFRLHPFLDAEQAGRNGLNIFEYLADASKATDADRRLARLLEETTKIRDVQGLLKERMQEIQQLFNQQMPFVPLWQLDRLIIISNYLDIIQGDANQAIPPTQLDLSRFFITPERWQLK